MKSNKGNKMKLELNHIGANMTELKVYTGSNSNAMHIFFSYDTPVAAFQRGSGYYVTYKKFSRTTSKHINKWVGPNPYKHIDQEKLESILDLSTWMNEQKEVA